MPSGANGTDKLATAHAYNWRSADSCALPYEVRQDMAYDPGHDSSGNVTRIGGKSFTYDPDSRLVSATQPLAGANPYQELAYDAFGNIIKVSSGTGPGKLRPMSPTTPMPLPTISWQATTTPRAPCTPSLPGWGLSMWCAK